MTAPLHALSAKQLLALYARGDASPVEVARAVYAHVDARDGELGALWHTDVNAALAQARESERRWQRGEARALEGVPVTLKENIATQGVPVPLGCAATVLEPATRDAPPAARLREAGAVFIGKTTMPDWGMLSSGLSSFHRLARNPHDLRKTPGGSSAGAGTACAAGYGPLHLGTDIGGSIRLPASWCGIVGFKPSLGRVPIDPPYPARVAGPMTRTVQDAALMMAALTPPDVRDTMSLPPQALAWDTVDDLVDARGLRVGVWLEAGFGMALDPQVRLAVEDAAARFAQAGASVKAVAPFLRRPMLDGVDRFWRMRSWLDFAKLPPERQAQVLPYIRAWISPAQHYSGADVFEGYSQMAAIRDATVAATAAFDIVLSPTAPCLAFNAEWPGPTNDPSQPLEHINHTIAFSMSEQPALSVPAGMADGDEDDDPPLPIGLQISGRRHDDLGVLRAGRLWEKLRGGQG